MAIAVRVTVGKTNRNPVALADLARRQANYLGPVGFRAMKDQTDARFQKRGYHRLVFPNLKIARRFQDRVDANCPAVVETKLFFVK